MEVFHKVFLLVVTMSLVCAAFGSADNPCCSFPCQNNGICMREKNNDYLCDCSNLDFYGRHCETPTFSKRIKMTFSPSSSTLRSMFSSPWTGWIVSVINNIQALSDTALRAMIQGSSKYVNDPPVYETYHDYPTMEATTNFSYYVRALPPVPKDCPTPMGTKGPKILPEIDVLVKKFFKRQHFRPDPRGSNVILAGWAQHFTHGFFKTDFKKGPGFAWGGRSLGIDGSNLYGSNVHEQNLLRFHKDGKLKMQDLEGEKYPMYLKDVDINMHYPSNVSEDNKFAMGHPHFGIFPGLFLFETIWMREHNRVCDILKYEHPGWGDERLFQTARLIIIGEMLKITLEEYVPQTTNHGIKLNFRPEILFGSKFHYSYRIFAEFKWLYHWHPLMPDTFDINGTTYTMEELLFNPKLVTKYGTAMFTDALNRQRAGQMTHHNHGASVLHTLNETIQHGRDLRFQSLNSYRKAFGDKPYKTFEELTGDTTTAAELKKLYGDIDALELVPGVYLDKRNKNSIFGETILLIESKFSLKGIYSHPLCSPQYWKPSTFGGKMGMDIVQNASLDRLFRLNVKGNLLNVQMTVPGYKEGDVPDELTNYVQEEI